MPIAQPTFDQLTLLARLARLTELNTEPDDAGALFEELGEPGWTAVAPNVPPFTPNGFYIAGQPPIPIPNAEGVLLHNAETHALAIGFRGVGGVGGDLGRLVDFYETGFDQAGHFAKFAPLLNAAAEFIADPDNAIETVYVGGHSLGGAMVQQVFADQDDRFFNEDLTVVGATFASPGARDVPEEPSTAETQLLHTGGEGDPVFGLLDNSALLLPLVAAVGPTVENVVAQFGIDLDSMAEAQEVLAFPSLPRGATLDMFEMPLLSTALDPATLTLPEIHSNSLNAQVFGELNQLGLTTQEFLTADRVVAYVTPDGAAASNDVFASDNQGNDIVAGFAGNDMLFGGSGDDIIGGGDDRDTVGGNRGDDRLYGQEGNDLLRGGVDEDELYGGPGFDELHGQSGQDRLWGGAGNDLLEGGSGDDRLSGQGGNDALFGLTGDDRLFGGPQSDALYGGGGDDRLFGGGGNDALFGRGGDDRLDGEANNDLYVGGGGQDAFVFAGEAFGADLVADFTPGEDHLRLIDVLDGDGNAVTAFEDLDDNGSGAIDGDDGSASQAGDALVLTLGAGHIALVNIDSLAPADVQITAVS
jgi:Ca2+-binding RTX toxin-like protein